MTRAPIVAASIAVALAAVSVALLGAGCGGADEHYTRSATDVCLSENGRATSSGSSPIDTWKNVSGGLLHVETGGEGTEIAFGQTPADARRLVAQYKDLVAIFGGDRSPVEAKGNAAIVGDPGAVEDCLR